MFLAVGGLDLSLMSVFDVFIQLEPRLVAGFADFAESRWELLTEKELKLNKKTSKNYIENNLLNWHMATYKLNFGKHSLANFTDKHLTGVHLLFVLLQKLLGGKGLEALVTLFGAWSVFH